MGQNGSGKTTLAKHLNGLLRPTSGRVVVTGLDTTGHPVRELARHVGYVFQNPGHQLFARTVAEELAIGPRNLGVAADEIDDRIASVTETLQLTDVLPMHPYRLPLPMRKLVTIASVLTMRPSVLVLDEPTTGQDHRTSRRITEVIDAVRAGGTTIVCVTHDMSLLAAVSDRVVVLHEGRSQRTGRRGASCLIEPSWPRRGYGLPRSPSCRSRYRVGPIGRAPCRSVSSWTRSGA